jgi:hypothetical protein
MTRPVARFISRSSLIGLLALIGASVTAGSSDGLAVDPATTSEPVVQVWGARTRGAKGIFGVHTWVAVKPEGAAQFTVYEVVGWRLRWSESVVVIRNRAPDSWFGAPGELYAEKRGPGVEELIRRIEKAVHEYPYANTYSLWPGPNSNTDRQGLHRLGHHLERAERPRLPVLAARAPRRGGKQRGRPRAERSRPQLRRQPFRHQASARRPHRRAAHQRGVGADPKLES